MGLFDGLFNHLIQARATIPVHDLAAVAADTAQYTPDGQPLSVSQVKAADLAIIDYVIGKIEKPVVSAVESGVVSAVESKL